MAYSSSAVYYEQEDNEMTKNKNEVEDGLEFSELYEWTEKPILVGREDWPQVENQQYLKGCKWSPDGTCLLIVVRSAGMHVVELPLDLYSILNCDFDRPITRLSSAVSIEESGLIYDFSWYPGMSSANPSTCCWASSGHLGPIQVWDAFTGQLRCSYKGYNAQDELETALSVSFSMDGQKVFGGYKKEIKVFETHRPGRECTVFPIESTISAIATSQARPGLVAFGSWKNTINLVMEDGLSFINVEKFSGHKGGITNMVFSKDGNRLYSGARKDNELVCWDLRQMNKVLFSVGRFSNTSQRIFFDVSSCGKWLASGGVDGAAQVWDVSTSEKPLIHHTISLHADCCNGMSLHPSLPIMATSSGQHHTIDPLMDSTTKKQMKIENSVCMWWMGKGVRPKLADV